MQTGGLVWVLNFSIICDFFFFFLIDRLIEFLFISFHISVIRREEIFSVLHFCGFLWALTKRYTDWPTFAKGSVNGASMESSRARKMNIYDVDIIFLVPSRYFVLYIDNRINFLDYQLGFRDFLLADDVEQLTR